MAAENSSLMSDADLAEVAKSLNGFAKSKLRAYMLDLHQRFVLSEDKVVDAIRAKTALNARRSVSEAHKMLLELHLDVVRIHDSLGDSLP